MSNFQLTILLVILFVTAISGIFPFVKKANNPNGFHFPIGEALESGVFLGAGLIHMLGDSAGDFSELNIDLPISIFDSRNNYFTLFVVRTYRWITIKEQ